MSHNADYDAGRITPEGRARLDKYGSTLDAGNVRLLCERIADYPEVLAAAAEVLAADDRVIEAATRAVWDHFYDGGPARKYGTKGWPPPEQHMPWWRGIAEAALNATRDISPAKPAEDTP